MNASRARRLVGILLLLVLLMGVLPASPVGAVPNGSPWSTTTTITNILPGPTVNFGDEVTFYATVVANHPPAAYFIGLPLYWVDVVFKDGTTVLGSANTGNTGVAAFSTSSLSVGAHSITAHFAGIGPNQDLPPWEPSTSAPVLITVLPLTYPTETTLTSSGNPSAYGQNVTFTAAVAALAGQDVQLVNGSLPTGQVAFSEGGTLLAVATLVNGQATFSTATLAPGTHPIAARYRGSDKYDPSRDSLTQTVLPADKLVIAKTSSANPSPVEETLTYTISVANYNAGVLHSVSVEDVLPAGLTYVSATPAGYYDAAQRTVRWELGDLLPGARRAMTVVAQPDPTIILETTPVTNLARAWAQEIVTPTTTQQITTITVATPAELIPRSIILRQEEDNYTGNIDTYLDFYHQAKIFGGSVWTYLRTVDMATLLTRFELTPLPAGAQITRAELRLYVSGTYPLNVPITVQGYRLLRFWDDDTATWLNASLDNPWETPGANGRLDRMDIPELEQKCFSFDATSAPASDASAAAPLNRLRMMAFDATALTQAWLAEPGTNFGVILKASICRGTALYRFFSSESPTLDRRPELYIEYLAPAGD